VRTEPEFIASLELAPETIAASASGELKYRAEMLSTLRPPAAAPSPDLKYRTEMLFEVFKILRWVPDLKTLLDASPDINRMAGHAMKTRTADSSPIESAAWISVKIIERALVRTPDDVRSIVIDELYKKNDNQFRWFSEISQWLKGGKYPLDIHPLTMALGFAMWYVSVQAARSKITKRFKERFIADIAYILIGDRLHHLDERRGTVVLSDVLHELT
jgi:hypothetical protein